MQTNQINPALLADREQKASVLLDTIIRPTDTPEDAIAWLIAIEQACMEKRREIAGVAVS